MAYPQDSILGPKLFNMPAEELFFFVIRTYIVCLSFETFKFVWPMRRQTIVLSVLLNKPPLLLIHLHNESNKHAGTRSTRSYKHIGRIVLASCFILPLL